ncbi:hypothetical protein CTI12_AA062540 [Artemisia annua]|uniref:Nucleic acid-binding, OB-fold protein n=1 Tax=Artemisia annua TaxID=35608 RepID=A0A2U1Q858_ARTAN|nr:hypothetical protein CTI12_AA062540 [Artemisia annua]
MTVDGLVSTFKVTNVVSSISDTARCSAHFQGASTSNLRIDEDSTVALMVLDFSDPGSSYTNTSWLDIQAEATRGSHSRTTYLSTTRRLTYAGRQRRVDMDTSPAQGPIAPPQRQGCYIFFSSGFYFMDVFIIGHLQITNLSADVIKYVSIVTLSFGWKKREPDCRYLQLHSTRDVARADVHTCVPRDKLREADIPNFQIRLFGVVGANQYELPTADTIGAIVSEGGPESMTDYDVVIERHSREPESVNKLHPTYMSLQFPLLFVYGEEGYHLNLTLRNSDPLDTQEEKKMTMKMYYAYQLCDRVGFSCIQLDKKANCVYRIQGFGFEKTDSWGKTLDNDFTLCLGKHTRVDLLKDDDFPYHYFNFAAYNELGVKLDKKNPILTDYIGYVHNVEKVKEYGSATGNKVRVRNIALRNLKYNQNDTQLPQLEVQTQRLTDWEQDRTRNRVPLATLLQIDPNTQQRVLFTQEAMILQVDTTYDWYYQKCDECGGKLDYGFIHGHCHPYGTESRPENSYSFRIVITDGTGNATMTCFSPQTDGLIKNVNTLLQEVTNKDPSIIPPQILALQNTRHVFQFRFAKPTGPSSPSTIPNGTLTASQTTPPPATPATTENTPVDASPTTSLPTTSTIRKELFKGSADEEGDPQPKNQNTQMASETIPPSATPLTTQETPTNTPLTVSLPTTSIIRKEFLKSSTDEEGDPEPKKQKMK